MFMCVVTKTDNDHKLPQTSTIDHKRTENDHKPPANDHKLPVNNHKSPANDHKSSTNDHKPPATNHRRPNRPFPNSDYLIFFL